MKDAIALWYAEVIARSQTHDIHARGQQILQTVDMLLGFRGFRV